MTEKPTILGSPHRHSRLAPRFGDAPMTLVVAGGRPGLGTTTLAIHLAAALAQEALRVVLIDADLSTAAVGPRCNITASLGIGDVLAGRKNIHEVLQRGPSGMQILAGAIAQQAGDSVSARAIQRLLKQMRSLTPHADCIVVDAGNQPSEMAAQLWSAADHLLMVTSPDAVAVMDTYALIKTLFSRHSLAQSPALVVNQAADEATAADVHRRIDQSCRRFLGLAVEFAGWLPMDPTAKVAVVAAATLAPAVLELVHRLHQRQAKSLRSAA
jgi:flagellar biosynthesis protein FlhG